MTFWNELDKLGSLFSIVSSYRFSFENVNEVPEYIVQAVPYFIAFFLLESIVLKVKRKSSPRINDTIASVSHGMLSELVRILVKGWFLGVYIYIYSNWRIFTLPWNSLRTWWIGFLAVDFLYYWGHRISHQTSLFWSVHQVHHSSEDYNLATAFRQHLFIHYYTAMFSFPLALAIPPTVYLVHRNLNLLYTFCLHTKLVTSLGPLEYILNTPSHHRVHHGRNRYCIDKNFGLVLIIWDRLFGTFEAEKEEVVYGLTHPFKTFEPFCVQFYHFLHIWRTFWDLKGWLNKLSVVFKGPGWSAGKPWLGNIEDIPEVNVPVQKYDPWRPIWLKMYLLLHFALLGLLYLEVMHAHAEIPKIVLYTAVAYQSFSLCVIGCLLDGRFHARSLELVRCISYIAIDRYFILYTRIFLLPLQVEFILLTFIRIVFLASALFWMQHFAKNMTRNLHIRTKKVD